MFLLPKQGNDFGTVIKENAELFKELLGESNKKKLKDARISDASDYLLKFFEGTQREGATVGSAAADVAAFATASGITLINLGSKVDGMI